MKEIFEVGKSFLVGLVVVGLLVGYGYLCYCNHTFHMVALITTLSLFAISVIFVIGDKAKKEVKDLFKK